MQKNSGIGGQAIIEGIMMRNGENYSIAVRKADGGIESVIRPFKSVCPYGWVKKVPILRGAVAFIDSMIVGVSSLMWSADIAAEEEDTAEKEAARKPGKEEIPAEEAARKPEAEEKKSGRKTEEEKKKEKEDRLWKWIMAGTVVFSVAFSVVLFMLLPFWLAGLLSHLGVGEPAVSIAEAVLRIAIFLGYMLLISRMKDIQRVFSYHGAEHKCINCIEHDLELTVDNVMKSSRQHRRCGTSFLLIVVTLSVISFLILGAFGIRSRLMRFVWRLLLIPVIAGVSFELLRFCGCHEGPVVNLLVKPGLALQKLVTREPDREMCEVAIAAVEAVFDWKKWQAEN